jgi:integrase/recombinase XerC
MKDWELIDKFTDYLGQERHLSGKTIKCYRGDLVQFCEYLNVRDEKQSSIEELAVWYNDNVVSSVSTATKVERKQFLIFKEFLLYLAQEGYKPTAIVRKLGALKSFYKMLCRHRMIEFNPVEEVKAKKVERKPRMYLTDEQISKLLEATGSKDWIGVRDRAIFETLYSTGMRISELVQLPLDSVNFIECVIHVSIKGRKKRTVPLEPSAIKALEHYLTLRNRAEEGRDFTANRLFVNKDGCSLNVRSVHRKMSKYACTAGMDGLVSPNMLRHSCIVRMLKRGMEIQQIKEILGYEVLSKAQTNYLSLRSIQLKVS